MKKFLIACFYLSVTLAICTASFQLPSMLNNYQDKQIFAKIEHSAMEPPELTYSFSLYDTLQLFSKDHYFVAYPSAGSKRTSEEIYAIASNVVIQLQNYGVISTDFNYDITNYTTQLQLAIVSEGKTDASAATEPSTFSVTDEESSRKNVSRKSSSDITTAVVWSCSIYFDSGYWIDFWIDDKSGKTVSFSMFVEQTQLLTSEGNQKILDAFADCTAEFAAHYYELPAIALEHSFVHSFNSLFEKEKNASIIEAYYTIQLKDENGILIEIPLKIRPECTILN